MYLFDLDEKGNKKGLNMLRRTGDSTRRLDRMVQEYFNLGFTFVYDSRITIENEKQFDHALIERFVARMRLEHPQERISSKTGYFSGIYSVYVQSANSEKEFPLTDLEKEEKLNKIEAFDNFIEKQLIFGKPGLDSGREDRLQMLKMSTDGQK